MMPSVVLASLFGMLPWTSSDLSTVVTPQVEVSIVMETAAADGTARAAVSFDLAPGWKTYWFDPGEVGIAPVFDFSLSNGVSVNAVAAPPPLRFDEKGGASVGFDTSVSFALDVTIDPSVYRPVLRAGLTFGLCQDVCVPMTAAVATGPDAQGADAVAIDVAFARLPEVVFDVIKVQSAADMLLVSAPGATDVFVYRSGWSFGMASSVESGRFEVPVLGKVTEPSDRAEAFVVAVTKDGAIMEVIAPSSW